MNDITSTIVDFQIPEAFIFLYEQEKFLVLKDRRIKLWSSDGDELCNFKNIPLCTKKVQDANADSDEDVNENYIVNVSSNKKYLLCYNEDT